MTLPKRLHFLGVRGQGLSALAGLMIERGHEVTACDRQAPDEHYDLLHQLADRLGLDIEVGNSPTHITAGTTDALILASYVPESNPEVVAARSCGISVLRREELLGILIRDHHTLAVAGVAGKSTTTAMAVHVARHLEHNPFAYIAAFDPNQAGRNYSVGDNRTAIVEACEFQRAFLHFPRQVAVITNLHWGEHIDYYSTPADMDDAFAQFANEARHVIVPSRFDHDTIRFLNRADSSIDVTHVGFEQGNDVCIVDRVVDRRSQTFRISGKLGKADVRLQVPGRHNAVNAAMACVASVLWGGTDDIGQAADALADFRTLGRRLEPLNTSGSPLVIDDYGHHPVHLRAAANSLREAYPESTIAVFFEPSIYRRTALLRSEYIDALGAFDRVFLKEIVVGTNDRPEDLTTVSSDMIVEALRKRAVQAEVATTDHLMANISTLLADVEIFVICGARRAGGIARRFAEAIDGARR